MEAQCPNESRIQFGGSTGGFSDLSVRVAHARQLRRAVAGASGAELMVDGRVRIGSIAAGHAG